MPTTISLNVNGQAARVTVDDPAMPLLYALRDNLGLHGPRFGCGLSQCGACTVHMDGKAVRSCVTPLSAVGNGKIVTLEGLGTPEKPHPIQQAFIDEQAVQCGYCINGMIMEAAALLAGNKNPSEAQIKAALANNLCRCGTHLRIVYMQDFRLPGMLHGRVVRPPAIGAALLSVDESSVQGVHGLVRVVRQGNFLAVVAESEWGAITAASQLKATWSSWEGLPEQSMLLEYIRATKITKDDVTSNVGGAEQALQQASKRLSATYDFAIHTHGSIGPSCAVAAFKDGKLTCWSASQATHNLRQQLAAMLSLPERDVHAIYGEGSGCYGRNGHEDAAGDAALLARTMGRPVRVQWMRADEHGWDPKGPPTLIDLQAGLDAKGNVVAWYSQFFIPEGAAANVKLVAAELAGLPHEILMSPGNILNNSTIPYAFPTVRTVAHRLGETPLRPSWIRAPGRLQNTFANEAFMDELAAAAGADPLEFRLRYLNDARGIEVLKRLARLAQWESRPSPKHDGSDVALGRGIAFVKYELYRTYVGAVATVEVNRKSGELHVKHFAVVHDCGQVINPDGVKNQIEGNVL